MVLSRIQALLDLEPGPQAAGPPPTIPAPLSAVGVVAFAPPEFVRTEMRNFT